MAICKRCDRCGKFYESYNTRNSKELINGFVTANIDDKMKYFGHGPYDLCPECCKEFMDWLKGGDDNHEDGSSVG